MTEGPPELARCNEHGLVLLSDDTAHHTFCIACELDVEVRLDDDILDSRPLDIMEFTNRLEADTVRELIPLMRAYLDEMDGGPLWVTHAPWSGTLPAGYTEQERFIPAIRFRAGSMVKGITINTDAEETIETLREKGYGG